MHEWLDRELGRTEHAWSPSYSVLHDSIAIHIRDVSAALAFRRAFPNLVLADGTMRPSYSSPALPFGRRENVDVCNLYNLTRAADAMRPLFAPTELDAGQTNLEPLPAIYPDQCAPIIVRDGDKLQRVTARWGLPTPPQYLVGKRVDRGVTNVRNPRSPHWRGWLRPENRCLVPFDQFAEHTQSSGNVWFETTEGVGFFAGIIVRDWTSTRKLAEGETTNDLFGFLTTDPNQLVGIYHPKAMPVILTDKAECDLWLNGLWSDAAQLQRPLAVGLMKTVENESGAET